jgi:hypothetical protein
MQLGMQTLKRNILHRIDKYSWAERDWVLKERRLYVPCGN